MVRAGHGGFPTVQIFGELFSGPGGLSLGARFAAEDLGVELRHAWAIDNDPNATATYGRHFPDSRVVTADVRDVDFDRFDRVDGMAFGFPCNDFSVVGERKGTSGEFGPLYRYCVRAVDSRRPKWFIAENVGGIRSSDSGGALRRILGEFEDAGYHLTPHLYRFEEYGIPQRRHRVMIVGFDRSLADQGFRFHPPAPTSVRKSAQMAIEDPPIATFAANHELTRQSEAVIARLNALRPGENAFSTSLPEAHRLNVKGARISQIYRRLMPDEPAYTVTGSGGGGTHVYHWAEPRALTNRERARLQTFPDWYVFEGGKEAVRRQIGMAVPPEGARIVVRAVLSTLLGIPYATVEPNLKAFIDQPRLLS